MGSRSEKFTGTVSECIEEAKSYIEELRDEITEWKENMESNEMEHLPKYEEVSECSDYLEDACNSIEYTGVENLPEDVHNLSVTYYKDTRKKGLYTRHRRMEDAMAMLEGAKEAMDNWVSEREDDLGDEKISDEEADKLQEKIDAVRMTMDEVDNTIGTLGDVFFPGMF